MICLQTRQGEIHIVNWGGPRSYITQCDLVFNKSFRLNLFALDDLVKDICQNCASDFQNNPLDRYVDDIDNLFFTRGLSSLISVACFKPRKGIYHHLEDRDWSKLRRYKSLLSLSKRRS